MGDIAGGPTASCDHDHSVQFYESSEFLAATVADYLGGALAQDGSALIVATPEHRTRFAAALAASGHDLGPLEEAGRLVILDASETLASFMGPDGPDRARFRTAVGTTLDRLRAGGGPVRIYGEMVAVLWNAGDVSSALALEDLWNDFAGERSFGLLCAYPIGSFDEPATAAAFQRVCRQHRDVIPADGFPSPFALSASTSGAPTSGPAESPGRVVAELQREVRTLRRAAEAAGAAPVRLGSDPGTAGDGPDPAVTRLVELLCAGDHRGACDLVAGLIDAGLPAAAVMGRLIAPAMHTIGEMWQRGDLSVADEHLATAVCERVVAGLYPDLLTHRFRSRERVIVAAVEGETHCLGARMVADVLEGHGYDVLYLGADVPADSLALAVIRHEPDLLALSVTRATHGAALERCLAEARRCRPSMMVLLGGQGVSAEWERSGYPVCDSAEDVARRVDTLLRERPPMPPLARSPMRPEPRPVSVTDGLGMAERLSLLAADFAALTRQQALRAHELGFLAYQDPLTGLPNRRAFDEGVAAAIRGRHRGILLLVDVDNFKQINDTYGHGAGDQVLREVSRVLVAQIRPGDVAARIGGDEFAVLVRSDDHVDAAALAAQIRRRIESALGPASTTVSIGGAVLTGDAAQTMAIADRSLYQAKGRGRNTVVLPLAAAGDDPAAAATPAD